MSVSVGYVKDAHGIKGEVFVRVPSGDLSWLDLIEKVQLDGDFFSIEAKRPHKDGVIFKLKEVSDRNAAEALKGSKFCIPENLLISKAGEKPFLREILGFEVVDLRLGPVGKVIDFASNGPQDLLVVHYNLKEQYIPFVEAFVIQMDFENKKLNMDLPEGLLE